MRLGNVIGYLSFIKGRTQNIGRVKSLLAKSIIKMLDKKVTVTKILLYHNNVNYFVIEML